MNILTRVLRFVARRVTATTRCAYCWREATERIAWKFGDNPPSYAHTCSECGRRESWRQFNAGATVQLVGTVRSEPKP